MSKKSEEDIIWQWKTIRYLSYFIVFITPFIIGKNLLDAFIVPKVILVTAITLFMLIFYFWGLLKRKNFEFKITPIHITLILFLFFLTLSSILGIDPINSFFGWKYSISLIHIYILAIFAFLIGFLVKNGKNFLPNILLSSFLSSLIVVVVFYIGLPFDTKEGSTIGNSSYLGEYLFFNIFFGLGLLFYLKEYWKKILIIFGVFFIFISPIFINKVFLIGEIGIKEVIQNPILFAGIANGALLGVGISILFAIALFLIFSNKKVLKVIGVIFFISLFSGIFYVGNEFTNPDSKIHKVYVEQKSGNRFLAWDIAKIGLAENPILGNGYNNYIYNYEKHFTTDFYKDDYFIERLFQPHNIFWEFASNTGILGIFSFLLLLASVFITFLYKMDLSQDSKRLSRLRIVLASVMIGYFIQNLFVFDTISTYLILFIIFGLAIGLSSMSYDFKISQAYNILIKIFAYLMIFISLVSLFIFVFLPYKESREWGGMLVSTKSILEYSKKEKDLQGISVMGGVLDSTYAGGSIFKYFQGHLDDININNKDKYKEAINYIVCQIENDIKKQPNYSMAHYYIGNYLNIYLLIDVKDDKKLKFKIDNYDQEVWIRAYNSLLKASELSPNNPRVYYLLSRLNLIKKDYKTAKDLIKKSIILAPENEEFYKYSRILLTIPDKDFQKYIDDMEKKWIIK